eukprot:11535329-Ditylum_brightwellii.AAC.2
MEANAAIVHTMNLYNNKPVLLGKIVADDDLPMKPMTPKGQKKKDDGQLPLDVSEPGWLADPT